MHKSFFLGIAYSFILAGLLSLSMWFIPNIYVNIIGSIFLSSLILGKKIHGSESMKGFLFGASVIPLLSLGYVPFMNSGGTFVLTKEALLSILLVPLYVLLVYISVKIVTTFDKTDW